MIIENKASLAQGLALKAESLKIVLGVLILFAGSQIAIPLEPVPITFQTVSVMLIGLLYSRRTGIASVALYITLASAGLPLYQGFSFGFHHLYEATGGYIIGFLASVFVMTWLRERFALASFWGIFVNCLIGTAVVFIFGISWLATLVGIKNAFMFGLLPFIIPGLAKALLLSGALSYVRSHNCR